MTRDRRPNWDQIEVGWILSRVDTADVPASSSKPRVFVYFWTAGEGRGYNSDECRPFGARSQRIRKGAALSPTDATTGRTFAIVHDDAQDRWEVLYDGRTVCALPDRLWGGDSPRFTRALRYGGLGGC